MTKGFIALFIFVVTVALFGLAPVGWFLLVAYLVLCFFVFLIVTGGGRANR